MEIRIRESSGKEPGSYGKQGRIKYTCPKCGNRIADIGEIRTTGSFITKIFDIQNRRFTSVTCNRCRYTEFYHLPRKKIGEILDLVTADSSTGL